MSNSMYFLRQLPGGICFAHGPYQNDVCPKWPACVTDQQKAEFLEMAQAERLKHRTYTQAGVDKLLAERERVARLDELERYTGHRRMGLNFDPECAACQRIRELQARG